MTEDLCSVVHVFSALDVHDGAGVKLHRLIGHPDLTYIDPFTLLDEFRSDDPGDYQKGFPWHPHRGIETVTYMIEGSFEHEDSKGGGGMLKSGTVQWMTAGKGIYHSEMPGQKDGPLWGYQLWLSLPAKDKFAPPRYQHLAAGDISRVKQGGLEVRLISGAFGGKEGPAKTWFPIDYFDVRLGDGDTFDHTKESEASTFLYVHSGHVTVETPDGGEEVSRGGLALFDDKTQVRVRGAQPDSGFLYISGRPNNEPIVRGGPFVMNTKEQLIEAFEDWQNGTIAD